MTTPRRFAFRFEPRYVRPAKLFRVAPESSWIAVDDTTLSAHFGPWHVETPLDNITSVSITGPYAFLKTAGPAHLGLTDRGLTFATNSWRGVCMEFREPITGIDKWGRIRHPNLTLTADDCEALAAALRRD